MKERFIGQLLVLRHAKSNPNTGHLTEIGNEQAKRFSTLLIEIMINNRLAAEETQLLTGPAHRLIETSMIISSFISVRPEIISRLSFEAATRTLTKPSPKVYEDNETIHAVLSALKPTTTIAIIIAHSEMMNDLGLVHASGSLLNLNFENMTGYSIDHAGQFKKIS